MKIIYKILAACIALSVLGASVLAYLVRKVDIEGRVLYDGLGRTLSPPPVWAKLLIEEPVWAGAGWHLLDIVCFFGGLSLALWLYGRGDEDHTDSVSDQTTPLSPHPITQGKVDMLGEVIDLMASEEYAAMTEAQRKSAVANVRQKHGFEGGF